MKAFFRRLRVARRAFRDGVVVTEFQVVSATCGEDTLRMSPVIMHDISLYEGGDGRLFATPQQGWKYRDVGFNVLLFDGKK